MNEQKGLPEHIAIIMDGNGRWARKRGLPRNLGHRQGVQTLIKVSRYCNEIGIKHLTVFAFSTENWSRPEQEVQYLLELLEDNLKGIHKKIAKNNIKLKVIGEKNRLSKNLLEVIDDIEKSSTNNTGMILNIAFNYGSKDEIIDAMKRMIKDNVLINKEMLDKYLYTAESGDVDLLIRTSGESRISNFLLWQIAYSELYFTDKFWPDFNAKEIDKAILAYEQRDRRFGGLKDEK